jgi:urea transport system ATP-binding protein
VIELKSVTKRFGGLVAVDAVDLHILTGELHCIIGANGAGKSTLLDLLTCEQRPTSGEIWLDGQRLDGVPAYRAARLGILRKFQVPGIFRDLTVAENLAIAVDGRSSLHTLFRGVGAEDEVVRQTLERIRLTSVAQVPAGALSHGNVQWLEIGMVLINRPRVLLLDEPTAGMTRAETMDTAALLGEIAGETEATMIIVEHDMEFVRRIGQRITVLHKGAVLTQGEIDDVERDPRVRAVYLGTPHLGGSGAA